MISNTSSRKISKPNFDRAIRRLKVEVGRLIMKIDPKNSYNLEVEKALLDAHRALSKALEIHNQ